MNRQSPSGRIIPAEQAVREIQGEGIIEVIGPNGPLTIISALPVISQEFRISGSVPNNTNYTLAQDPPSDGFAIETNEIIVPLPGRYELILAGPVTSDQTTADTTVSVLAGYGEMAGTVVLASGLATRYGTNATRFAVVSCVGVKDISDPDNMRIWVRNSQGVGNAAFGSSARLTIKRLGPIPPIVV